MILNLGCNDKIIRGAINIDSYPYPGVDVVMDLREYLRGLPRYSVDGIYLRHVIEHFDQSEIIKIIEYCHYVLKIGGFLDIYAPHSSSMSSVGSLGHFRTFGYGTLREHLSKPNYIFREPLFVTLTEKLSWWYGDTNWKNLPKIMRYLIPPVNIVINFFIKISPKLFENFWGYWIGGAREVQWYGVKLDT